MATTYNIFTKTGVYIDEFSASSFGDDDGTLMYNSFLSSLSEAEQGLVCAVSEYHTNYNHIPPEPTEQDLLLIDKWEEFLNNYIIPI